jgi:hypothetical protein
MLPICINWLTTLLAEEFSIPINRTMKLQEIQEAHRIFERGGLSGKIVLVP